MKTIYHKLFLLGILVLISKQVFQEKVDDIVDKDYPKKSCDPVNKDKPKKVEKDEDEGNKDEGDEDEGDEGEDEDEEDKKSEEDKKIKQNFKNLDLDGNGYLSIKEIYQSKMKENRDQYKRQLEIYGNALDMDGDGFVNKIEYDGTDDVCFSNFQIFIQEFDKIDTNKNGYLTFNEFDIYYVQTQTKKFLDKYDVNLDKQLSKQEYKLTHDSQ